MIRKITCIALFFLFAKSILSQEKILSHNHIEGAVYDLNTKKPIANATVLIEFGFDKYSATTDVNGKYSIKTSVRYVDKEYPIKILHKNYYDLNGVILVKEHAVRDFGMKARVIPVKNIDTVVLPVTTLDDFANSNWTILIDVSSSMSEPEKLNILNNAIKDIVELFRAEDIITIFSFSSKVTELLPPTSGSEKNKMSNALSSIKFGGTTKATLAIETAFQNTSKNYIKDGNNRILIFTDGMFSSGKSDYSKISKIITNYSKKNINTSIFLLGKPTPYVIKNQEKLAQQGNGTFAVLYDDNVAKQKMIEEAKKVKKSK